MYVVSTTMLENTYLLLSFRLYTVSIVVNFIVVVVVTLQKVNYVAIDAKETEAEQWAVFSTFLSLVHSFCGELLPIAIVNISIALHQSTLAAKEALK